jgi:dephospho-CoA kinase
VPLVYVTGLSGVGKSAVGDELRRRGYEAHDTDRDGNAVWVDRETGQVAATSVGTSERDSGWLDRFLWRVVPARVEQLAARARDRLVFLCGSTENEEEVWQFFSLTIYLTVDEETLRHRLATRTSNDFGKLPHELAAILEWHKIGADQYRTFGSFIVDASRPLASVVDDVIQIATRDDAPG